MALVSAGPGPAGWAAFWAALASAGITAGAFAALWLLSLRRRDCSVVDLYWAFGFAVIAWIEFAIAGRRDAAALLTGGLVTLWAVRLGAHLVSRHAQAHGEDPRYLDMRLRHGPEWERRSFWMVFMLQAACMWLIATPIHAVMLSGGPGSMPPALQDALFAAGVLAFAAGFAVEAAADAALARFKADRRNRGRLLTTGLFAWSRHPNYFGEALLWWGVGLVALALSGHVWALLGPAFLTLLLLRVSGVPVLDAHLSSRPGFAEYVAVTPGFWPRPPARSRRLAPEALDRNSGPG